MITQSNELMTLKQAGEQGYGRITSASSTTLMAAIKRGKLKAVKQGRDWYVNEEILAQAGYVKIAARGV